MIRGIVMEVMEVLAATRREEKMEVTLLSVVPKAEKLVPLQGEVAALEIRTDVQAARFQVEMVLMRIQVVEGEITPDLQVVVMAVTLVAMALAVEAEMVTTVVAVAVTILVTLALAVEAVRHIQILRVRIETP